VQKERGMAINDTLMLSVTGQVNGTQHVHTLHFRQMAAGDAATALVQDWKTNLITTYRAAFRLLELPVLTVKAVYVCGSVPLPAGYEEAQAAGSQAGTTDFAGTPEPSYMAALIRVKTAVSGRRYQGRFFIGGLGKNDTAGNAITSNLINRVQPYLTALAARYIASGFPDLRLVVHSRYLAQPHDSYVDRNGNTVPAYTPGECQTISTPATQLILSTAPTTMRSRKLGHGL
jgi:hypothetical protein